MVLGVFDWFFDKGGFLFNGFFGGLEVAGDLAEEGGMGFGLGFDGDFAAVDVFELERRGEEGRLGGNEDRGVWRDEVIGKRLRGFGLD